MKSNKQLLINIITNVIAYGTSLAITFILTPYLIRTIGKDMYSFYPLANNFVGYFMIISTALNSMASRFITISISKKDFKKAETYFSSVFFANVFMTIILAIPMLLVVIYLPYLFDVPLGQVNLIRTLFGLVFASNLINVLTSVYGVATFATNRLDFKSGAEIIQGVIRLALYLFLYTIFKASIVYVGVVTFVLALVNLAFQILFTRRLLPDFKISRSLFDWASIKEIFASGLWNSLNSLGNLLLVGTSLYLANILLGANASGDLSIVQTVPSFITSIISLLFNVFMPRINHAYASACSLELRNEVLFSQKILGQLATTPIVLIMLFGESFFSLWIGANTVQSIYLNTLSILTIAPLIIHANMWTIYGVTIATNNVRFPAVVLVGAGILNVIVTSMLLGAFDFGANGIYMVPIVSGIINVLYYLFFLPNYVSFLIEVPSRTFYPTIVKSMVYATGFYLIAKPLIQSLAVDTWLEFLGYGAIFAFVSYLIHTVILFNRQEIKTLLTSLNDK